MPTPPPPPGVTFEPPPPPGVKFADVSDPPSSTTAGDTFKRIGKAILPGPPEGKLTPANVDAAVRPSPTQAGIERVATGLMAGGPAAEAGEAIIGMGMVGRAAGIGLLNGIQQLWEKPKDPMQAVKATGWGMGLGLAGEAATSAATKTATAVAPYAKSVASKVGEMTPNRVKALFHIQEFAKAAGRSPEEIDALTKGVEAQGQFAAAHQKILDVTSENFHQRYDDVLGKPEIQAMEAPTTFIRDKLNEQLTTLEKDNRIGQLSSGVQSFIKKTQEDLDPLHASGYKAGSKPAAGTMAGPDDYWDVSKMRSFQSSLRKQIRGNTTPTDRMVLGQVHDAVSQQLDSTLADGGATPEDLTKLRQTDQDYRRFRLTMDQIGDPRKALTGAQAAQAIFDAADSKNYGAVDEYIKLAKAASEVHPEVMSDLKDAMLTKMFADATQSSASAQTGAAGMASSLRQQASVLRSIAPDTAETLFGKGSPMADKRAADKIFGALGDPAKKEQAIAGVASGASKSAMFRRYAGRALIIGGVIGAATGKSGSLYSLANKVDPMTAIALGVGVLYGPEAARFVFGRTSVAAQKAYTNWLLEPGNTERFQQMVDGLSAAAGRGVEETNDTNAPANP